MYVTSPLIHSLAILINTLCVYVCLLFHHLLVDCHHCSRYDACTAVCNAVCCFDLLYSHPNGRYPIHTVCILITYIYIKIQVQEYVCFLYFADLIQFGMNG